VCLSNGRMEMDLSSRCNMDLYGVLESNAFLTSAANAFKNEFTELQGFC